MDLTGTFAEGAMRKCFRMKKMSTHHAKKDIQADKPSTRWATQQNYVAKTYKDLSGQYRIVQAGPGDANGEKVQNGMHLV